MVGRGENAKERRGAPKKRVRKRYLFGPLAVLAAAGLVVGVPEWMLARGTRDARRCLAEYEAPRGPERPSCGETLEWFLFPARVPWTSTRARYRAEELNARIAMMSYVDASVGAPDEKARKAAAEALASAAKVVREGSQRVSFEELGRSIGAPDPGRDADELGDRSTLVEQGELWLDWRVRLSTLRATLLVGDQKRAELIGKRYADYDPRDQDLRTGLAALFCLGDDPGRGFALLPLVQDDRATRRYEGLSRNFGEARALLVACAARAGKEPPALPTSPNAGVADAEEARTTLALSLLGKPSGASSSAEPSRVKLYEHALILLESGPRRPRVRIALLASLLAAFPETSPDTLVKLAKPHLGEEPYAASSSRTALEWLADPVRSLGDEDVLPLVAAPTYLAAARAVAGLETSEAKGELDTPTKEELLRIRGALWLEAAAGFARAGDAEAGLSAADEATRAFAADDVRARLWRSNVRYLCGDRERAYRELAEIDKVRPDATNTSPAGASALIQRAELALSLGKREDAIASGQRALESAKLARDVPTELRASWLLAALAVSHASPPVWEDLDAGVAFQWLGFANPTEPWLRMSAEARASLVNRALSPLIGLRVPVADAKLRRAARFALLRDQGDLPPWLATHFVLLGSLLDSSEGDVEVFLDAATALDSRRFALRSVAFARAEAARMRGDMQNAARWEERYRFLRGLATDPAKMDLARHLDI